MAKPEMSPDPGLSVRGPWMVDIFLSSVLARGWRLGRGGYPEFRAESAAERLQSLPRPLLQGPGTAPLLAVRGVR